MKMSLKIFLSMCFCAIASVLIALTILLAQNYDINIKNENKKTTADFNNIVNNLENDYYKYDFNDKELLKVYNDYYSQNNLKFTYINNGKIEYSASEKVDEYITGDILETDSSKFLSKVISVEDATYLLVSTAFKSNEEIKIVCIKDISYINKNQIETRNFGILIAIAMAFCSATLAYVLSNSLTQSLKDITIASEKISQNDYDIKLKESNTEFGKVAVAFNKMSEDIRNRTEDLVKENESKQAFMDNLSHEMNTPLTTIKGYSEYLERANVSPEEQVKYLQYIQQESTRIRDIYKKLLLLSYKRESDLEILKQDFRPIINTIETVANEKVKEKNIKLTFNNSIETLECDKTLVQIAVLNLINNAMNVSEDNSQIIVNCYEAEKKIIEVIDFGIGISEENIEKILEPFYRVDKARSRENGGAGLGLSICKNIMEMHKGEIKIESKLGEGSKFILIFP